MYIKERRGSMIERKKDEKTRKGERKREREREGEKACYYCYITAGYLMITATCADYCMACAVCSPSGATHCIHLIDEDNAGSVFASLLEEIPHSG